MLSLSLRIVPFSFICIVLLSVIRNFTRARHKAKQNVKGKDNTYALFESGSLSFSWNMIQHLQIFILQSN